MTDLRDADQEFDDIIQRCVEEMEQVKCPMEDYLAGLKSARSRFDDLVQIVRKELGQ